MDIPVIDAATPQGFAIARVWGVSLQEIGQARDLVGKNITIAGGMQKGLPLAKPAQSGTLVSGVVFQAFGNWIGTDMTLDFVIAPGPMASNAGGVGTLAKPRNLTLNWQGGQQLGPALQQCLQTGFPGYTVKMNISANIVPRAGDTPSGFYSTLEQLTQVVKAMSLSLVQTKGYAGVSIVVTGTTINVFDGSGQAGTTTQIAFEDLIGQPTWIESPNIQFKTVMRADLALFSSIKLPPAVITNTQQANSQIVNQRLNFQGGFKVISLRHVGNFRQPSADAWVSVVEAAPQVSS